MSASGAPAPRPRRGGQSLLAAVVVVPVVAAAVGLGLAASSALDGSDGHSHRAPAVAAGPAAARPADAVVVATEQSTVQGGVRVELSAHPAADDEGAADVRLQLRHAVTGAAVDLRSRPLAWADPVVSATAHLGGLTDTGCATKVSAYQRGGLGTGALVDLNAYDVLTLNGDGTISVIDPMANVAGMTQLKAMVTLGSPGEDWAVSEDERRLFVTLPDSDEVVVVDLDSYAVTHRIPVGERPVRAALEPGGDHLWVTVDEEQGGVTAIDTHTLEVVHAVPTGAGPHSLVFSGSNAAWGAVSTAAEHDHSGTAADGDRHVHGGRAEDAARVVLGNGSDGTVSVVDPSTLDVEHTIDVSPRVTDLAVAEGSDRVYAAGGPGRPVTVLDPARGDVVAQLPQLSDTSALRFAPGGRWGFALAEDDDRLAVFDVRSGRVAHDEEVGRSPDRVVFTATHAYVHSARSPEIGVVELARLGSGGALPLVRVSGGQGPPADGGGTAVADPVFPLHDTEALFANPADTYVYTYMAGMNAPMGGHQSYAPAPRAVRVVDRSLREVGPGAYAARVRLPRPGSYQLALLADSPRVVACFPITAAAPTDARVASAPVTISEVTPARPVAGAVSTFRFLLREATPTGAPVEAEDVQVVATEAAGLASGRGTATSLGGGRYEVELSLTRPGSYELLLAVPSRDIGLGDVPPVTLEAVAAAGR